MLLGFLAAYLPLIRPKMAHLSRSISPRAQVNRWRGLLPGIYNSQAQLQRQSSINCKMSSLLIESLISSVVQVSICFCLPMVEPDSAKLLREGHH
jgi:hypothetical protein